MERETTSARLDLSLRPNAESYRDRRAESSQIISRIEASSASVIAIAGVRGAGKSSLALKVLGSCESAGYFAVQIHSPTGYEPRDFLVAVFQSICEELLRKTDSLFGSAKSLTERGRREASRLRQLQWAALLGIFIATTVPIYFAVSRYESELLQADQAYIAEEKARMERDLKLLSEGTIPPEESQYLPRGFKEELQERVASGEEYEAALIRELETGLEKALYELEARGRYRTALPDALAVGLVVLMLPATLLAYVVLGIGGASVFRLMRRRRQIRRNPLVAGLRALAEEKLEYLRYQTTHQTTGEAAVSIGKVVSSTFGRAKSLETRPISLPGLTAEFRTFLGSLAEVYGGKVVICLDELDKIDSPEQLDSLLRGVKGILGRENTYFLLTVSEDAMARFATRKRMQRGMVESSFEEVVSLDRVSEDLVPAIIENMLGSTDEPPGPDVQGGAIASLLWAFGAGIPREIRRSVVAIVGAGLDPIRSAPFDIWRSLYSTLLDSLDTWVSLVGADDRYAHRFAQRIETARSKIPQEQLDGEATLVWAKNEIEVWSSSFPALLECAESAEKEASEGYQYERAALEALSGTLMAPVAAGALSSNVERTLLRDLREVFRFVPRNFPTARDRLVDSIKAIGCSGKPAQGG